MSELTKREKKLVHSTITIALEGLKAKRKALSESMPLLYSRGLLEIDRILIAHKSKEDVTTFDLGIIKLMHDVAIELDVSFEEWSSVIRIKGKI